VQIDTNSELGVYGSDTTNLFYLFGAATFMVVKTGFPQLFPEHASWGPTVCVRCA
jgi:hypothetical protein